MSYALLYAEQDPPTQGSSVTAAAVRDALLAVQTTQNVNSSVASILGIGNWVGPAPRITRVTSLAVVGGRPVRVAWLYEMPDPAEDAPTDLRARFVADQRSRLLSQATTNLRRAAENWTQIRLIDYDPAVNGSIAWWRCNAGTSPEQCASSTVTRDAYDPNQQLGGVSTVENAVGPTPPPSQRPGNLDVGTPFGGTANLVGLLKTVAVIGVIGVGLYVAWPYLRGVRRRGEARANPRYRRRRRTRYLAAGA